ncbi:hemolysin family protein [Granulicoccus phenolivorans]|uniref:hemolysin family protein n=1 Tax=Granulicoccus phenolivorans TaxID=266854 RepID=UPI0003F6B27E|nr:hemolysin family protein [Granulicoccus phenolivorans]
MSTPVALLVLVLLLLANAFFVAAEFAMVSARRDQIEPKAQAGSGAARWALKGIEHVSVSLAATQLGITACSLVIGAVGEPALASLLVIPLHAVGLPTELSHVIALVVALLIVTFLHMVFGEMVPKNIAIAAPSRTAILLGPVLHVFVVLFRPLIWVMNHLSNLVVKHVLRTEPADEVQSTFNSEEVSAFVAESTKEGLIDRDEGQLLHAAVKFEERTASDAAVPGEDLVAVRSTATIGEVEQLCAKTGYSRFPVLAGDGTWLGYLHAKDVVLLAPGEIIPATRIRRLATVAPDLPLREVVRGMQAGNTHMCAIDTGDDTTSPVIMLEDALELLIGEIVDATSPN